MRFSTIALRFSCVSLIAVNGISCGGNAPPATAANPPTKSTALQPHQQAVRSSSTSAQKAQPVQRQAAAPTIPAGARFSIFCTTFTGSSHAADAQRVRQQLASTGLREWHLLQGEKETTLYYGYYRSVSGDDPKEAKERARAHNDLKAVSALIDPGTGQKYFRSCWIVALDDLDPTAPTEWDLRRAPGYWSLQIAAFRDDPRRKEYAIQTVRELRQGGLPAFYFHGPAMSSVCVGAFPVDAVKVQRQDYQSRNPGDVVLVAPESFPLPDGRNVTRQGENVDVVKPKVEVLDPMLLKFMRDFPHHADNGVEGRRVRVQGEWKEVYQPSFLVVVPGNDSAVARQASQNPTPAESQGDPFRALQRGNTQGGKLRGITE